MIDHLPNSQKMLIFLDNSIGNMLVSDIQFDIFQYDNVLNNFSSPVTVV